MSKYEPLWKYLKENNKDNYKLNYEEIKNFAIQNNLVESLSEKDLYDDFLSLYGNKNAMINQ